MFKGQFNENQNSLAHTFMLIILPKHLSSINSVKKPGFFRISFSRTKKGPFLEKKNYNFLYTYSKMISKTKNVEAYLKKIC
jgi:hypothetical protein